MELRVQLYDNGTATTHEFQLAGGPIDDITNAEAVLAAVGHVTVSWARIEQHIDILLIQINKADHSQSPLNLHDERHPWRFVDKIELLKTYFNKHPALSAHTIEIREITSGLRQAAEQRNDYVHSIFEAYDAANKIATFRIIRSIGNDNFSIIRSEVPLERIIDLTFCVNALNNRLTAVSGSLFTTDALQRLRTP